MCSEILFKLGSAQALPFICLHEIRLGNYIFLPSFSFRRHVLILAAALTVQLSGFTF